MRIAALFFIALPGCSTTTANVITESPTRVDITCSRSLGDCYARADEECPNGFKVVDGAEHNSAIVSPIGRAAVVTPIYSGEMIVECN